MKTLIIDTNYPAFLQGFYRERPELARQPYAVQWRALMEQCFGTFDAYSAHLTPLGYEAHELIANSGPLQRQWAAENVPGLARSYPLFQGAERIRRQWQMAVLRAQIAWFKPEVIYVQDVNWIDEGILRAARPHVRLIIAQIGYAHHPKRNLGLYDLILTSFPHVVPRFRALGLTCEYFRIGFDQRVLKHIPPAQPRVPFTFVGGISPAHYYGNQLLEELADRAGLECWGYGAEALPQSSAVRRHHHGKAWGTQMYRILAESGATLNRHGEIAENFANNMRLYEATGVGTCLVTDLKDNLAELFELDQEVVAYSSADDCAEKVCYLLDHEEERAAIARAGQQRTLREHTYAHRMQELTALLEAHIRQPARATRRTFTLPSVRAVVSRLRGRGSVSHGHRQIAPTEAEALADGWKDESIPAQQRRLVAGELQRMYRGDVVPVFRVAAEAVQATGIQNPLIAELGCASAYYSEVLPHLLGRPIRYVGLDYSTALLRRARHHYAPLPLAGADATALPLAEGRCDIVFSSALLMHVPDYRSAIAEAARVTKAWCIFHRTPVCRYSATTTLAKYAYGVRVVELVFNATELREQLELAGLEIVQVLTLAPERLPDLDEPVEIQTIVCRKRGA